MAQKKHPIEYRLLVRPTYDETLKKHGVLFHLETTKQFTNFSYMIDVKDAVNGTALEWTLHGLRAPSMNMPATGAAKFSKVYFDLPKTVDFTLVKKGKVKAGTGLDLSKSTYSSARSTSTFLRIYTDEQTFEANRSKDITAAEPKPDQHRDAPAAKPPTSTTKRR